MTPAEVARVAQRYGNALLSLAAEIAHAEPLACLIEADRAEGLVLSRALWEERGRFDFPDGLLLVEAPHVPASRLEAAGEAWRTFGEALRAEVEEDASRAAAPIDGETLGSFRARAGLPGRATAAAESIRWMGGRWVRHG